MGIRYIAIPVHPLDIAEGKACPRCYLMSDPFPHGGACDREPSPERELPDGMPEYLDLDKCWGEIANLLALPKFKDNTARPLVEGTVRHTGGGWIPHYGVLDPAQVADATRGLEEIEDDDIREHVDHIGRHGEHTEQRLSYVLQYLDAAKTFTRDLAQAGYGLIYIIG